MRRKLGNSLKTKAGFLNRTNLEQCEKCKPRFDYLSTYTYDTHHTSASVNCLDSGLEN